MTARALPIEVAPDSGWNARRAPGPAEIAAHAALREQAKRTVDALIEARVAAYAANPKLLDMIAIGLSKQSPARAKLTMQGIIAGELPWRPMSGEIPAINLRAALIYLHKLCEGGAP